MINITRINHSAIASDDKLDAMRHFYEDVLGVNTVKRDIPEKLDKLLRLEWHKLYYFFYLILYLYGLL